MSDSDKAIKCEEIKDEADDEKNIEVFKSEIKEEVAEYHDNVETNIDVTLRSGTLGLGGIQ